MFERLSVFVCGKKKLFLLVALAYFASAFLQYSFDSEFKLSGVSFGLPRVYSGDEPEYLLTLNSLLVDNDFKLSNNYKQAFQGGCQAGENFAGKIFVEKQFLKKSDSGLPELASERIASRPIIGTVIEASVLWPFAGAPCIIEPLAIFLTLLVSLATIFFTFGLLKLFGFSRRTICFCIIALAFASPFWFYAKSLWSEPFLAFFFLLSFLLLLKRKFLPSGFFLAMIVLAKPTAFIFAALFFIFCFFRKEKTSIPNLFVGFLFGLLFFLLINAVVFGNPFFVSKSHEAFSSNFFSDFAAGFFAEFFAPQFGFLLTFPLFIFVVIGFWFFFKKNRSESLLLFFVLLGYIVFWAQVPWIIGGTGGYSFRYLVPLLPVMMVPIGFFLQENKSRMLGRLFWIVFIVSLLINIQAAFTPFLINNAPWFIIEKVLSLLLNKV